MDWSVVLNAVNSSVTRQKGDSQNGCFKKAKHVKFFEKRKFDVLRFLEAPVLRLALLSYYRRTIVGKLSTLDEILATILTEAFSVCHFAKPPKIYEGFHSVKSVCIRSFSGPCFSSFGSKKSLNTGTFPSVLLMYPEVVSCLEIIITLN